MKTINKQDQESGLSEGQKQAWDRIIENLWKYFNTEEGVEFYERFLKAFSGPHSRIRGELSEKEQRALHFIEKERGHRRSPTVREVAKAVGCTSSRTGQRIVLSLRNKRLLR